MSAVFMFSYIHIYIYIYIYMNCIMEGGVGSANTLSLFNCSRYM